MPIDPSRILFRDDHLLIVNKRAGELVVKADDRGKMPLYDFLHKAEPGLRVVHRLDFGTSGVIVFALTAEALRAIRDSKFEGWIKTYVALVHGRMQGEKGTISRKLAARTRETLVDAVTQWKAREKFHRQTLVELTIETGRKHQIRQHLQSIGHPLVLDPAYGDMRLDRSFKKHFGYRRFFLHALRLAFPHPVTGKKVEVSAPIPPAFQEVLVALRRM
jgi:RluA family pseudouridine synthase